ncbi:MAG: methyltransferase domain-containing protein [Rhodospirillales bacterium]|nr:methyltransferase domain-containing protein [Rhodospirillales bacterium]
MIATDRPLAERLLALWDHLGLEAAHVATQIPGDLAGFAAVAAARIAGLAFCVPTRLDPAAFQPVASRVLLIAAETGLSAAVTARGADQLAGARRVVLAAYDRPGWADVVADRTEAVTDALLGWFTDRGGSAAPRLPASSGQHAGITWRATGQGPALVLLPFFLAPSQWEPAIPALAERFTVIVLGGPHLGGVAMLEDRARAPSYRGMAGTLFDLLAPGEGTRVLDVGCGSGALDRMLAARLPAGATIVATDLNPFLLAEAEALAAAAGHAARIRFVPGNAEALPFPDAAFDHAFTVTVLEECDADRALGELVRVVRPGGRIGVIVRAIDLPQWWNLALPEPIRRKVSVPPQSVARAGLADASLYARMRAAGLEDVRGFPSLVTLDRPEGPIWRYREEHALSLLDPAETVAWRQSVAAARAAGTLLQAHPMHCAVGVRPGGRPAP